MVLQYDIIASKDFKDFHRDVLGDLLKKQGKVQGDYSKKIDRCKIICIAKIDNLHVAIGAIKNKTSSDFAEDKADLKSLAEDFEWELGYLYTKKDYEGMGLATNIVNLLLNKYGDSNIMASTEITTNPAMVRILERNGFRLFGKPWKSGIHGNHIGLFLRFK